MVNTLRTIGAFAASAMPPFVLILNKAEQVIYRWHKMTVASKDFAGMVQAHFGSID